MAQPISKRQTKSADHDAWEHNRMVIGGAAKRRRMDEDLEMEVEEERVALIVHDIKPPFLDGRTVFTKQIEPVQVVKDPTSDFVQISKKGSQVLKHIREQNDRSKMREKFWDLAGTKMGSLLKVQKNQDNKLVEEGLKMTTEGEVDYKADNQYAAALKSQKNQAVSAFS